MRRWSGWVVAAVAALALALVACGGTDDAHPMAQQPGGTPHPALPAVTFQSAGGGTATLYVEVADTPELEQCGLMHRTSMPEDQAMLFVFLEDSQGAFWNRNTFIPLTLAWIAADGTIVDLTDMAAVSPQDNPQNNTLYTPRAPYRYVIEANQGWFARHGVAIGDHASVADAVAYGSRGAVPICREKGL